MASGSSAGHKPVVVPHLSSQAVSLSLRIRRFAAVSQQEKIGRNEQNQVVSHTGTQAHALRVRRKETHKL